MNRLPSVTRTSWVWRRLSLGALFTLGLIGSAFAIIPAYACGPDSDCMLGQRTYRIQMPETSGGKKPLGAIIFAHGYRGSAAGLMKNKGLSRTIADMGLVFVAPKSAGEDWDIPNAPNPGNNLDFAYFKRLKKELVQRHGVDGDRIMVSGFSAGGMMVWNLACRLGDTFAAYAPIAGTFWAPVPEACPAMPVPLIHIHGTSDKIVPLKGRPIGSTRQGDVRKSARSPLFGLCAPGRRECYHRLRPRRNPRYRLTSMHRAPLLPPPFS
ncbi:MAG: PHB depolymerase family esterase, partial [Pseudomonadota bacterium]